MTTRQKYLLTALFCGGIFGALATRADTGQKCYGAYCVTQGQLACQQNAGTTSCAHHARSSCEAETGLPECGTVAPGNHCCIDYANVPNVICQGWGMAPIKDSQGHWHCQRDYTAGTR